MRNSNNSTIRQCLHAEKYVSDTLYTRNTLSTQCRATTAPSQTPAGVLLQPTVQPERLPSRRSRHKTRPRTPKTFPYNTSIQERDARPTTSPRSLARGGRLTCRSTADGLHGSGRSSSRRPSSGDVEVVLPPATSAEPGRLIGPGQGMTLVSPAARSAPLAIDFLKVRGLRCGSCWATATKKMGQRMRRRSAAGRLGREPEG